MSAIVQVFPKQVGPSQNQDGAGEGQVDGSAIFGVGNYLPSITSDDSGDQQQGNGQNGNDAAAVLAALGAPSDEFEAFVDNVTQLPQRVDRPIGTRATNVALWQGWSEFTHENIFDLNIKDGYGGFRPEGVDRAGKVEVNGHRFGNDGLKFSPLNGKAIAFPAEDWGIRFDTPYELAAEHTTVSQEDYENVYLSQREAHINEGNPFKHRLGVMSLNGMTLTETTDI